MNFHAVTFRVYIQYKPVYKNLEFHAGEGSYMKEHLMFYPKQAGRGGILPPLLLVFRK